VGGTTDVNVVDDPFVEDRGVMLRELEMSSLSWRRKHLAFAGALSDVDEPNVAPDGTSTLGGGEWV
jgi:uncharacterized protein YaeQ